ncbi:MAG: hypothetical protein LUD07_03345 [Clostridiales bacterium]|nr:hypothetical protein [Clostridiales bacterium]
MRDFRLVKKENMSERNQALMDELNKDTGDWERFKTVFSKWRFITYFWIVFLPPYGLYRVWSKETTFYKSEKYCWTFMIIVYMVYFAYHFVVQ